METTTLHCEGLPCPQPVIQLKKLLETTSPMHVDIIVDNEPALENVTRFLTSRGYEHSHTSHNGLWHITALRIERTSSQKASEPGIQKTPSGKSTLAEESKNLVMLHSRTARQRSIRSKPKNHALPSSNLCKRTTSQTTLRPCWPDLHSAELKACSTSTTEPKRLSSKIRRQIANLNSSLQSIPHCPTRSRSL